MGTAATFRSAAHSSYWDKTANAPRTKAANGHKTTISRQTGGNAAANGWRNARASGFCTIAQQGVQLALPAIIYYKVYYLYLLRYYSPAGIMLV